MTHKHHPHDRLFPAEAAARLDDPARLERQPPRPVVELLELAAGHRVLDFGAGTGYYAIPIASRLRDLGPGGRVCAVDSQPAMLDILKKKLHDTSAGVIIESVVGSSAIVAAVDPSSFDRALMANVVHEVPDRHQTFSSISRALIPGGVLVIVDWDPAGSPDHGPPADHRLPATDVVRELANAGFASCELLPCYRDLYVIRARNG